MKKAVKKLALSRETLRSLAETSLIEVAGAATRGLPCSEGPSYCVSICINCVTDVC